MTTDGESGTYDGPDWGEGFILSGLEVCSPGASPDEKEQIVALSYPTDESRPPLYTALNGRDSNN